jgi:hypothetical protein
MEINKQIKEKESLKKARQRANRKHNETTVEEKFRREKEAQNKRKTRSIETPLQAKARRRINTINMAEKRNMETPAECEDIQNMRGLNIPTGYVIQTCGKSYATSPMAVT